MTDFDYKEKQKQEKRRVRAYWLARIKYGMRNITIVFFLIFGGVPTTKWFFNIGYSRYLEHLHSKGIYDYTTAQITLGKGVLALLIVSLWCLMLYLLLQDIYLTGVKRK